VTQRPSSVAPATARWVAAFTLGQCAAVVRSRGKGGEVVQTFAGVAKTLPEAEEAAVSDCVDSGARYCPLVFNNCMCGAR